MRNFFRNVRYYPRNFIRGIKNLITWFPIIWLDRQWDQMFFLKVLEKKLKLMEDYFEDGKIIVGTKRVAKQMRICRILIERLKKDEYEDILHDRLDSIWGRAELSWHDLDDKKDGYSKLEINYKNVKTKEDEKKHTKALNRIREHRNMMAKQDKEYFAKMFIQYLDGWWE